MAEVKSRRVLIVLRNILAVRVENRFSPFISIFQTSLPLQPLVREIKVNKQISIHRLGLSLSLCRLFPTNLYTYNQHTYGCIYIPQAGISISISACIYICTSLSIPLCMSSCVCISLCVPQRLFEFHLNVGKERMPDTPHC